MANWRERWRVATSLEDFCTTPTCTSRMAVNPRTISVEAVHTKVNEATGKRISSNSSVRPGFQHYRFGTGRLSRQCCRLIGRVTLRQPTQDVTLKLQPEGLAQNSLTANQLANADDDRDQTLHAAYKTMPYIYHGLPYPLKHEDTNPISRLGTLGPSRSCVGDMLYCLGTCPQSQRQHVLPHFDSLNNPVPSTST